MSRETVIRSNRSTYYVHWLPANPSLQGSLHHRGGPLDKYDQAFGTTSLSYENTYNKRNTSWEGHCHASAVVAAIMDRPKRSVTMNGVVFTPDDILALVTKTVSALPFESLWHGQRYPEGELQEPRPKKLYEVMKRWSTYRLPVIFDVRNTAEVWNYPFDTVTFDFGRGVMEIRSAGFPSANKDIAFNWSSDSWTNNDNIDFAWLANPLADLRSINAWPVENSRRMNPFFNPHVSPRKVGEIYLKSL